MCPYQIRDEECFEMTTNSIRWYFRLLRDERGAIDAAVYILIVTILGIGLVVGLAEVRSAAVQGLGDIAAGMEAIDQSYTVTMTFATMDPMAPPNVKEFGFEDLPGPGDAPGQAPHGIVICLPAEWE